MQRKILFFIVLFASFSLVYSSVAYYVMSRPAEQGYMAWGVFSPSGTLSNYFSGTGVNVTTGKTLSWHFAITNRMGIIQYVRVVYRLGNATTPNPDPALPVASLPELGNSSIFVASGQTGLLNFTWTISSKTSQGNLVFLTMAINGQQISSVIGATGGQRFRFMFEMWTFDSISDTFQYGYKSQNSRVGLPLQVWFNSI